MWVGLTQSVEALRVTTEVPPGRQNSPQDCSGETLPGFPHCQPALQVASAHNYVSQYHKIIFSVSLSFSLFLFYFVIWRILTDMIFI